MNHEKLRRLKGDLDQQCGARQSVTQHRRDISDELARLTISINSRYAASGYKLGDWRPGDDLAELLAYPTADLRTCHLDAASLKHAIELQTLKSDLQARIDALDAQITPLSQLVGNLTRYVEEHAT